MTTEQMPDDPVFIGGLDRSGKTYMRLMLAAYPALAITKRTNLWTHIYGRFGDLADPANLDRCLSGMLANKHIRAMQPDREFLRREFQRGPRTYAHLFAMLYRQHAQTLGKTRWGDQTESLERFADPIFSAFPKARIIHMLRDPRDRYEAIVARGSSHPGRLGEATAQWIDSAHLALRNERLYSDRYKVMQYETLVTKPEKALREVCAFLGITLIPDMLALGSASRFKNGYKNGASKRSPLSTEYIGRFQHHLASYELAYIQQRTELLIAVLGYSPVPVRLSPIDRARCAAVTAITYFSRFAGRIGRENPLGLGALS